MEHLTASDAEVLELSGIFPSAKDHGVDGAETCGKADGGALGMWQAPGEPGSLQTEEHSSPGEEALVLVCHSINVCVLERQQGRGDVVNTNRGPGAPVCGRGPFSVIR